MSRSPWVAVEATTDKRERARELVKAHRHALEGRDQDKAVRQVIRESWRRSAAAGVDPAVRSAPVRLSDGETRARLEHGLLSLAPAVLRQLREEVQSEDEQIALLCDPDGTILWIDGDPRVLDRANSIHLSLGAEWSEKAVGTNAMGTALAVDHPVQIFAAEHFAEQVHPWTCAAAPLHDPDTGEPIGVIDLSGGLSTAHPHSLALVATAAREIEAMAARESRARDDRLRELFGEALGGDALALVNRHGKIVDSTTRAWVGERLNVPAGGGPVSWRERALVAEPVADGAAHLLVRAPRRTASRTHVEALGRNRIRVLVGSRWVALSPRHSELFLTLHLRPNGMTAEELTLAVWGRGLEADQRPGGAVATAADTRHPARRVSVQAARRDPHGLRRGRRSARPGAPLGRARSLQGTAVAAFGGPDRLRGPRAARRGPALRASHAAESGADGAVAPQPRRGARHRYLPGASRAPSRRGRASFRGALPSAADQRRGHRLARRRAGDAHRRAARGGRARAGGRGGPGLCGRQGLRGAGARGGGGDRQDDAVGEAVAAASGAGARRAHGLAGGRRGRACVLRSWRSARRRARRGGAGARSRRRRRWRSPCFVGRPVGGRWIAHRLGSGAERAADACRAQRGTGGRR